MIARSERADGEVPVERRAWESEGLERGSARAHVPVLLGEVLEAFAALAARRGGWIVDGTLGAGGHARALLEAFPALRVLGIDQDPDALAEAERTLSDLRARAVLRRGRMSQMAELCAQERVGEVVGVLFDLGASSMQFDRPERGFSLHADGPLDMRMDPERRRTAADIVNRWDEEDLADLFFHEGGERRSRRIASAIVEARGRAPFLRTGALAELVARAAGGHGGRIHPATKVFQSLRRAVNEEGDELLRGLACAEALLANGGRLVVLTFHSGEDGMVKRFLAHGARAGRWSVAGRGPRGPGADERRSNRRARSARLRCGLRLRAGAGGRGARLHDARGGVR